MRFGKAKVTETLQRWIDGIQGQYRFDPANGYAQVEGKDTAAKVSYGRYSELLDLADELELAVDNRDPRYSSDFYEAKS